MDACKSPLAQPRNIVGGFAVSSFLGVTTRILCGYIGLESWTTGAIAVAVSILGMNLVEVLHPPGAACALVAVIGGPTIWNLGFGYMATSVGAALIMLAVAVLGNNLMPSRQYPIYWY